MNLLEAVKLYDKLSKEHLSSDYPCSRCFEEHEELFILVNNMLGIFATEYPIGYPVRLSRYRSFMLSEPYSYKILKNNNTPITISNITAHRIEKRKYLFNTTELDSITFWIACNMITNQNAARSIIKYLNKPLLFSFDFMPVSEVVLTNDKVVSFQLPVQGYFMPRLHKFKMDKEIKIYESAYLWEDDVVLSYFS